LTETAGALKSFTLRCHNDGSAEGTSYWNKLPQSKSGREKKTSPYAPGWYQAYLGVSSNPHAQTLSNTAGHVGVYNGRGGLSTMTHPKMPE